MSSSKGNHQNYEMVESEMDANLIEMELLGAHCDEHRDARLKRIRLIERVTEGVLDVPRRVRTNAS